MMTSGLEGTSGKVGVERCGVAMSIGKWKGETDTAEKRARGSERVHGGSWSGRDVHIRHRRRRRHKTARLFG